LADFPIVGIGSSAGGLEALEKLFEAMPPDTGAAFVVVAHLDPTRESHLAELLSRRTRMPTVAVEGATRIEPNHVYVIAPDQVLMLDGGVLQPSKPKEPRAQRHPVDVFFRSLAENQKERAIGIVLSGTGSNGAAGLRFIKSEGGVAMAQEPATAAHAGMPQSAIATGLIDLVLPPERMAEALVNVVRHPYVRQPDTAEPPELDGQLSALLALLRTRANLDFRPYRRRTLLRRIHRRMGLHQIQDADAYLERLRRDPEEVTALARDLTITVSGFFRDPEAWRILDEKVIAPLVAERDAGAAIRIWVPGCATGEEAYSLAILVLARAEQARKAFDLRIFATDVAQHILPTARAGLYPASIAPEIGAARLERFFDPVDDSYQAKKVLRDAITFAPQNLLQDPPFSRLDLISCRNLLIYLDPEAQRKVVALFHFALRENGHLFLGSAESVSGRENLFRPVSKKWRIFRRVGPTRPDLVHFPLIGAGVRSAESEHSDRAPRHDLRRAVDPFQRVLLERFAPASVLIDRHFQAHAFHGPTGDYLQQPGGEPTSNLLALARDGLQAPLRTAVQKAIAENGEASSTGRVRRAGSFQPIRVTARPLRRGGDADGMLVVSFFEREWPEAGATVETGEPTPSSDLESELLATREDLRITLEQMETANEELRASNEEIRSMNEELQASNEELETSKEELQSLNEELNTANNQLQAKVEQLEVRTNDLNNLLNSTDIATLFLDRNLCIRWFTPTMRTLLELLPADLGRPISHFAQRFEGGDLVEEARKVLERLLPLDAEVVDDLGRWYLRRILPYRTDDDRIDGVAVTFTEITERKHSEEALQASKQFAEGIVQSMPVALLVLTAGLTVQATNAAFRELFQVSEEETLGRHLFRDLSGRQWDIPELRRQLQEVLPRHKQVEGFEVEWEFVGIGRRALLLSARRLDSVDLILLAIQDITARKRAEEALRASEERLRRVLETDAVGVLFFDKEGTVIDANDVFLRMTGYSRDDLEARRLSWRALTPPEWLEVSAEQMDRLAATGHLGPYEKEYLLKDGSRSWMLFAGSTLGDGTAVEYVIDISGRKRAEHERELLSRELSHRVKNTLAVVQALAMQTDHSSSVEEFRDKFLGRLSALARAHSILLDAQWRGADLKQLVEQALQAYEPDRPGVIEIQGDPVPLSPTKGLGLSLILHELATNAAKYGALAHSEGRVSVSWKVEQGNDGRRVRLRWKEQGVPELEPPKKRGFGTRLIERACRHELEGEVELDYAPGGLRWELVFALS
jgi:two-component system CheB/CheR fusion protein